MLEQSREEELTAESFARTVMQWSKHRCASVHPRRQQPPPTAPRHASAPPTKHAVTKTERRESPRGRRLAEVSEELQAAHRQVAKLQKERKVPFEPHFTHGWRR